MRTRTPFLMVIVTAVLASLVTWAVPGAQAAPVQQEKPRPAWSVAPAGEGGGAARSSYVYTLPPGAVLRDKVRVDNTGNRPVVLDLYGVDAYQTDADGAFALRNPDEPRTGVGAWVTLGKSPRHSLRPGKGLIIPFELRVPRNAEPGDHAGAVVAAGVKAERSGGNGALGFDVRRRIGVRIYVRVEGPLDPGLEVSRFDTSADPALVPYVTGKGDGGIDYQITNSGNVRMTPEAQVRLLSPWGSVVHEIPVTVPELLPGSSVSGTADLASLPPLGLLKAELVVRSPEATAREAATIWSVPWAPVVLLLGLVVAWWLRRRHKAGRRLLPQGLPEMRYIPWRRPA